VTLEDALMSAEMLNIMFGNAGTDLHVTIGPNSFPGTYAVVGKTFARDTNGVDHLFTFYIPKAKIQSENTLTMEAEGDPSVFNMSLRVLNDNGKMMELILDTTKATEVTWTDADTIKYAITFITDIGSTTLYVDKGGDVTIPDIYEEYTFPELANDGGKATKNATYYGVGPEA
jgi:hypothetical protein